MENLKQEDFKSEICMIDDKTMIKGRVLQNILTNYDDNYGKKIDLLENFKMLDKLLEIEDVYNRIQRHLGVKDIYRNYSTRSVINDLEERFINKVDINWDELTLLIIYCIEERIYNLTIKAMYEEEE